MSRLESFRKEQAKAAEVAATAPAPLDGTRSRLDSFRAARGLPPAAADPGAAEPAAADPAPRASSTGFSLNLPAAGLGGGGSGSSGAPAIPALSLGSVPSAGSGPLSARKLKKEVLNASSSSLDSSNAAGTITLRDELGTPRSVRVVQSEEHENFNMIQVKWVYTLNDKYYQILLRHGRRSGIRKIYVNKEMVRPTLEEPLNGSHDVRLPPPSGGAHEDALRLLCGQWLATPIQGRRPPRHPRPLFTRLACKCSPQRVLLCLVRNTNARSEAAPPPLPFHEGGRTASTTYAPTAHDGAHRPRRRPSPAANPPCPRRRHAHDGAIPLRRHSHSGRL